MTVTLTTTTVVRTIEQELSKEDRIVITFTALGLLVTCIICGCCIDRIRILVHRTRQALPELPEKQDIAKVMRRFSMLGTEDFPTQLQDTAGPVDVTEDHASRRSRESHVTFHRPDPEEQRQAMPHEIREAASVIEQIFLISLIDFCRRAGCADCAASEARGCGRTRCGSSSTSVTSFAGRSRRARTVGAKARSCPTAGLRCIFSNLLVGPA
eukprot:s824_g6.t1